MVSGWWLVSKGSGIRVVAVAKLRCSSITTLVALTFCAGCVPLWAVGDNFVRIKGSVAGVQGTDVCHLAVYTEKGEMVFGQATVSPTFERSMGIGPGTGKYYVEVSCEGRGRFRSDVLKLGGLTTRRLDLGTISLQ